jgi:hypothetical protein
MIATTAAVSGLVVLLLVVFNLFKEEESRASQSNMIYKSAEVLQDTSNVLRGARNQKIIGIKLEMAGETNPSKLTAMAFNAMGTSEPISSNVSNARLWYTGNDADFQTNEQLGSTVKLVDSKDFIFQVNKQLKPGVNYFWLTFDIDAQATVSRGSVDAICREVRVGAVSYRPQVPSPQGKRFIEANIPYYSMGNFAINKLNSWNSKRDGSGTPPRELYNARNSYFIQAGHTMVSSNGGNFQILVVESGGDLKITSPLRLNMVYVACNGKIEQDAEVEDYFAFNHMILEGGATYVHNNTGMFPAKNYHFSPSSSVEFLKLGKHTLLRSEPIEWGCVKVKTTDIKDISLDPFSNVVGMLDITSANSGVVCCINDEKNFNIGALKLSGVNFKGAGSKNNNEINLHIGSLSLTKSTFTLGSNAKCNLYLKQNVNLNESSFLVGSNNNTCYFNGNGVSQWQQSNGSSVIFGNVIVESGHILAMLTATSAEVAANCSFTVLPGAKFFCGNSTLQGEGDFVLAAKATIGIGHEEGLCSSGAKGNIRTAGREFNTAAIYVYNGTSSEQNTGVFETTPRKNSVNTLILQKQKKSQVLLLSQSLTIEQQFNVLSGDVHTGKYELKVPQMQVQR